MASRVGGNKRLRIYTDLVDDEMAEGFGIYARHIPPPVRVQAI